MAETKKEINNESVKQLGAYKNGKLAELNFEISREKTRAAVLTASILAKREALAREAEELKLKAETEQLTRSGEDQKPSEIISSAEIDAVEPAAQLKKESAKAENAPEASEGDTAVEKPVVKEEIIQAADKKPEAVKEVKKTVKSAEASEKNKAEFEEKKAPEKKEPENEPQSEKKEEKKPESPFGERRIYVPPAPTPAKPRIQTRVFGHGGYQSRGSRPGGQNGTSPNYQGNRPQQGGAGYQRPGSAPRIPGQGGFSAPPTFPKAPAKGKAPNKPGQSGAKFDDRNALNKRALIKKGYIVDDKIIIDDEDVRIRNFKANKNRGGANGNAIIIEHAVITTDPVPIKVLSERIGKTGAEIIKTLFLLGTIKTINESIDFDTAELVAGEFGITLEYKPEMTFEDTLTAKRVFDDGDESDKLMPRPPIVTIMGHVDHGKTSLLDYIRNTNVTGGEAGGITQHIGAYTISLNGSPITFLDTPGHEAFTSMRARGAQVTDIAVLVVAADDGIMPQTIEAINHAKQAGVPIIVAVNKMDKTGADPERVMQQLTTYELIPEDWGGETPVVKVSAKTGDGVKDLLANILTLAEIKELKANPDRNARGTIIEARLDKGMGKIATILVQTGTLRIGDNVVAGVCTGKIRAMIDDKGRKVKKAGPSIPVSVTGWDEVPEAGDIIDVVNDEKFAKELAEERKIKLAGKDVASGSVSLNDLFDKIKKGELKSVKLIIKADVQGSLEAVKQSLGKLGNEEVDIDIIHGAVGAIKESDVSLADTAKAIIIGFNVRADAKAKALAAQKNIDIRFYDIIYNAIEDIEKAVKGLLEPKFREVTLGSAEVREVFKITGAGAVAGSHVTDGKIVRGAKARLVRDGKVEYTGEIASLRHNKDDVKEMGKNFDCGITLLNYQDIKQGDVIEAFEMEKIDEN